MSFQDVRMSVEEIFYFPRVDVFSAADDHVLDPADDPAVAVLINHANVPVMNSQLASVWVAS